jgi:HK97 family phage major capsid protein
MDAKELNDLANAAADVAEKRAAAAKAEEERIAGLVKAGADAAVEAYKSTQEPAWKGGFATKKVTKLGLKEDDMDSFMHYVRTGDRIAAKAAMIEGTDSFGGFLVPIDFHNVIQTKINETSWPRRAGVQVLQGSRDVMQVPAEGTSMGKFSVSGEDSDYNENEPQLDPVSITAYKWTKLLKLSEELVEDQAANLEEFLSQSIADWAAQTESYYCAVGTGSSQHTGVCKWDSLVVPNTLTQATSAVITAAEIFTVAYTLNDGLRDRAVWLMNGTTEAYLRQLGAPNQYGYAFGLPSVQGQGTSMGGIFGRPVFNTSALPAYNAATCEVVAIAFFDPKAYTIYERRGLVIRRLNELYAAGGMVGIIASFRQGGAITQGSHIVHYTLAQTS